MPKRKKLMLIPDFEKTDISGKLIVQKSNPLQSLSETPLTLAEFKILDAYLARIDSHKPDKRYVVFEKGELEEKLGVTKIPKAELDKRLKNLFQPVKIQDKRKPNGVSYIALFTKAAYEEDEDGFFKVILASSPEAMEYIFNIENIGYLKYTLKNIIDLTSRYSYILFLYFESNRHRQSWEVSLENLKKILNCTAERYENYKFFNSDILKKCQQELHEKTAMRYSYESVRTGRKVTSIKFTIEKNSTDYIDIFDIENDSAEEVINENPEDKYSNKNLAFLAGACNYEFTEAQMEEIFAILVLDEDQTVIRPRFDGGISTGRYSYLQYRYATLNSRCENKKLKPISNRFSYFKRIITKDIKNQYVL